MIHVSNFAGIGGALIVSIIAFTIVFVVLTGLSAMIYANRYISIIVKNKETTKETVPSAPVSVSAPVDQMVYSDANDMKKVVAAISAAINASIGRRVNILSVARAPVQGNSLNMTAMWRIAGIAECMEKRLGSHSW
jgi:Na+-transporting methylmalonyl-CoA/oxaloacetate decarboxylase gamma subunit